MYSGYPTSSFIALACNDDILLRVSAIILKRISGQGTDLKSWWLWTLQLINKHYYSFKILPQFWLAKSTRIIHHNQLLMTKFGRILCDENAAFYRLMHC